MCRTGADPDEALTQAYIAHTADEVLVNCGDFSGLPADEGGRRIVAVARASRAGEPAVTYRLRDWLISRQRYWGTPIPVIYCEDCGTVPVPEEDLPVLLPETVDYAGSGENPLDPRRGVPERRLPAVRRPPRGARPTRWTRSSTRPGTGIATCRPHNDDAPVDPDLVERLDAGRPVHRRRRARRHAPALQPRSSPR